MAGSLAGAVTAAQAQVPLPIHRVVASTSHSYEGGTMLQYGINMVTAPGIANALSLPAATGSGHQVDVHNDADYFVVVWPKPGDQINRFGLHIGYALFPAQRLRFLDVGPGRWDFTTNLPLFYPIYNMVPAFRGGGQAGATYLGMGTNVVRGAFAHNDSLKLPIAVGGVSPIIIYNDSNARLALFPNEGQKINRQANNEPYPVPPGKLALFHDIGPGPDQWIGGVVDAGYPLQFAGREFNPQRQSTYYTGQGAEPSTTEGIQRMRVPRRGRIASVAISFVSGASTFASTEPSSIYIRRNGTQDYLVSNAVLNDRRYTEVVVGNLEIPVLEGDWFEIKWVTPGWSRSPSRITLNGTVYIE